ncbi:metal ABC transporter solute-binding protein, Zn/Mn family [Oceanobacillus sojae]|uniref:metal ABC transporter solute-binding protein, Zn/Mn family n=1 Tax=Oceanobacillus sojae TaxID=582851 RepID=UPI0021A6FB16|nr:zinc ABC transporter substrate-binding protein [Oceanobacillus sojae]MCT1903506.1 zinc ABC transporter substrate-binding protein [Oceanobacillus sojae]
MQKKAIQFIFIIFIILLLAACSDNESSGNSEDTSDDSLTVYTTIYPLEYFTERIGGADVNIENVIPPGADAHSFEPTSRTMVDLAESDAFIYSGAGLEEFADTVIEAIENEEVLIVNATEGVNFISGEGVYSHDHGGEDEHEGHEENEHDEHNEVTDSDPHVWLDPNRSITIAENIKNKLIELKPESEDVFEVNFNSLKQDLEELDSEFKKMVGQAENKTFLVSHSAYGYWEDVYGLEQIGISGLSTSDEPSQQEMVEIINLVKENNLKYIYFEPNLSNKIAETTQRETGTETLTLSNLESITEENINSAEDYFDIMKKNIDSLQQGFE